MKIPKFEAQTEWVKPTEFPDLRDVDEIAIDLETKDPDLLKKGSGSVIGNGEVIGIAVATKFYKGYFPIAHEGGGNHSVCGLNIGFTIISLYYHFYKMYCF